MPAKPSYAVIGAGIGGLALAGFLARNGVKVRVYEQAKEFQRIGAGIQMSPNAVRVLRALGLEPGLRKLAFYPPAWSHRVWDTGEHLADLTFGAEAEARYGAPYLLMHRGDLHAALFSAVPEELIAREKKLLGIDRNGAGVTLSFADGTSAEADAVIGADGVHSRVREILLGPEKPRFTGRVAHRTTFPAALMGEFAVDTCTKWWGPDRHIVIYPVRAQREEVYFVTSVPDPTWNVESWSSRGEMGEVLAAPGRLPRGRAAPVAGMPAGAQVGAVRARSAAQVVRRADRLAGRRLPSHDTVHGAGRRERAGGCRHALALHCGCGRPRRGALALRGDAARAHLAPAAHLAPEHLGQGHRSRSRPGSTATTSGTRRLPRQAARAS